MLMTRRWYSPGRATRLTGLTTEYLQKIDYQRIIAHTRRHITRLK
jgi:predicted RNA-binding protein|eukprot:COSAG01_NODE_2770_length_7102_cov_5.735399_10_plen_45_part_00